MYVLFDDAIEPGVGTSCEGAVVSVAASGKRPADGAPVGVVLGPPKIELDAGQLPGVDAILTGVCRGFVLFDYTVISRFSNGQPLIGKQPLGGCWRTVKR